MLTITPPWSASRKYRSAARVARITDVSVMLRTRSHCSSVMSTTGVWPPRPGVVDQDVEPAHAGGGRGDQRVDLRGGRHVADNALHPAQPELRQLVAGLAEPPLVVVGDDDVGALGQRAPRDGGADAGAGGGRHDDDLAVQQAVAVNLFRRIGQSSSPFDLPG